jgi:hypothetical protein
MRMIPKLILSLSLMTSCNSYDPDSCPKVELQNIKTAHDWTEVQKLIRAAYISCSFQNVCVKSIDFKAGSSECAGWWD